MTSAAALGPLFADLLRAVGAVPGLRRVRYTSPHPKDFRADVAVAMAETADGLRAPAPAAAVGQRPDPGRHAPGLHRRPVPRSPGRGPGHRRRPGGHDRHHRRVPGRDRRATSSTPSRWPPRPTTTAPTRSSTRPAPAPRPPARTDSFVAADVVGDRYERLRAVIDRSTSIRHEARIGRVETVVVEGPSPARPGAVHGPHPAEQAGPRPRPPITRGREPGGRAGGASRHPLPARRAGRGRGRAPRRRRRIPVVGGLSAVRPLPTRRPRRPHGVGASRRWPWPGPRRAGDVEIVSVDSMQVYRGMDIGTAKPTPGRTGRRPPPPRRSRRPGRGLHGGAAPGRRPVGDRGHRAPGEPGPPGRGNGPAPAGGRRRPRDPRSVLRRSGPSSELEADTGPAPSATAAPRSGGRRTHGADESPSGGAGPGGHPGQRPAVLVVRPRTRPASADPVRADRTLAASGGRQASHRRALRGADR